MSSDPAMTLAVVGLVPTVFSMHLPNIASVRESADDAGHYMASLRSASLTSCLLVAAATAATGSPQVAIAGGITIFGLAALYMHARGVAPWGAAEMTFTA